MIEYSCSSDPGWWLWYFRVNFDTTNLLANERAYYKILVNYTGVSPNWYWYVFAFDGDKRSLSDNGRIPSTTTRSSDGAIQTIDNPVLYSYYDSTNDVTFYSCPVINAPIQNGPNPNITYAASSSDYYNLPYSTWAPLARTYFDNYTPGQGVGEVTLLTEAPSQLLTFTSQKLGKSFKYWIRGNQTIKLYTPGEEPSELIIFRNGAFSDAVIDGFDLADYKEYVASGAGAWNPSALAQWFRTKYGLVYRQPNAAAYQIQNSRIVKPYTGYGDVSNNYLIPINRTRGEYTKLRANAALLARESSIDPLIRSRACWVSSDGTTLELPSTGIHSAHNYNPQVNVFEEYGDEISDIDYIDYVTLEGVTATVAYDSIKLIKDSVNVSERPRNVIFENGQWGPGVTTDFDYRNAADYKVLGNDWSINTYTFSRYILFNHDSYYQADTYLISVSDNCFYRPAATSSTSYLFGQYKIPLKRATGYTKISFDAKLTDASNLGSNLLCARGVYVNSNDRSMSYGQNQIYYQNATSYTDWTHFELDISDMPYIDYLQIEVDRGCVKYRNVIMT